MSTEKRSFADLNQKILSLGVTVFSELNESNLHEAQKKFYTYPEMTFPPLKHDAEKLTKLENNFFALGEMEHEIAISGCTETERMILEKVRQRAMLANRHALRILLCRSEIIGRPEKVSTAAIFDPAEWEKLCTLSVKDKVEYLQKLSQDYYGYQVDQNELLGLLHDTLIRMSENKGNWTSNDQQYLAEIRSILDRHQLISVWDDDPAWAESTYRPNPETLKKFGQLAGRKLSAVLEYVPEGAEDEVYSADKVVTILNEMIEAGALGKTRFRAIVNPNSLIMSVAQEKRQIKIPLKRAKGDITRAVFQTKTCGHEVGTHVMRGVPYEDTELLSLSTGFLNYEGPEEGIATCVEQGLAEIFGHTVRDYAPIDYYVNIGLADLYGLNFRELWILRRNIIYLTELSPDDGEDAMQRAMDNAYGQIRRVFRGTGNIIEYKDLCYHVEEGRTWQFIDSYIDQPDELWFTLMGLGKVNVNDPETLKILQSIVWSDDFPAVRAQLTREKALPHVFGK